MKFRVEYVEGETPKFNKGDLVQYDDRIVMCNIGNITHFDGIVLASANYNEIGERYTNLSKKNYKVFTGKLILTNK